MNKLMIRHTMDKPLPYDAEVEYLESSGTQYIDTGILATSATSMECQFAFLNSQCPQFMCMGCTLNGSRGFFNVGVYYNVGKLGAYMSANAREGVEVAYDTQYHTYYLSAAEQRIDSTTTSYTSGQHFGYNTDTGTSEEPIDIWLFARNISWQPTGTETFDVYSHMTCRLKYVRIMNNGILVRDYIPVRKGNTGYLYDKVSGRLFGNQGTGSFVVGPDYNHFAYQYLTFVPLEDSTFSFAKRGTGNDIEYSIDGGAWTSLASEANTPTVGAGHNIRWRAELTPSTVSGSQGIGTFSATGLYDAMGNTMSLLYGDNFVGQTTLVGTHTFYALWRYDTHIYKAENVVLSALLTNYCYNSMYRGCTSLVAATPLLATTMKAYCCQSMYFGCTSLTTISILLATTMAESCCRSMYMGCTSLVAATPLLAPTLAKNCYFDLYNGCINLQHIKMLATDITAASCLNNWVRGVASTGTFVKHSQMTTLPTGTSGIPSGWTVVDDNS